MIISVRFFAYSLIKPDVAFSYTGTGSGAGRRAIRNGLVDFAGSDSPLSASDLQIVSGASEKSVTDPPFTLCDQRN